MTELMYDEHKRPLPPPAADETTMLLAFLDYQRATFAWKCSGLDAAALTTRIAASTMTLGGMLKHLAIVEDSWFTQDLHDLPWPPHWPAGDKDFEEDHTWEWRTAAADTPAHLRTLWEDAVTRSRRRTAEAPEGLDTIAKRPWDDGQYPTLRWILLHMIEEYARHNGHADLLREAIDGTTGE